LRIAQILEEMTVTRAPRLKEIGVELLWGNREDCGKHGRGGILGNTATRAEPRRREIFRQLSSL